MSGRRASVAVVGLLLVLLALPAYAQAGGARMKIQARVNYADTVGIVVEVGALRHEKCGIRVGKGSEEEEVPPVDTGSKGGARWSWLVPGNVTAGTWRFEATCSRGKHLERRVRKVLVGGGFGRRSHGLWVERSMHWGAVRLPSSPAGNGGGSALYPVGQCTWWVARQRPDLPYFAERSGDAKNWAKSAAADGFPTGAVPAPGAVAVFAPGQYEAGPYGHVAYVTAVEGGKIRISEYNFKGDGGWDTRKIAWAGLRFIYRKGETETPPTPNQPLTPTPIANPSAVQATIELHGLVEDTPVAGAVPLSAVTNAAAVRFSAFYFTDLADPESGRSVTIGEDRTAADGFTATWDTTTVPNQGGPGGRTVVVTATVLEPDGEPAGVSSSTRVNVANSRTVGGVTFWPYYVVGTCEDGECEEGLHLRSGPSYDEYPTTGHRFDGEELDIICQGVGEPFISPRTHEETNVWDKLTSGDWVIDYYVDTPNRSRFSAPLPRCN